MQATNTSAGAGGGKGISVLVVEDDVPNRWRLRRTVESSARLRFQAASGSCAEALGQLARAAPDIVLIDLALSDGNGLELIRRINRGWPGTRSIVITVFDDEEHVIPAIYAGASGYLLKDASDREIGEAIEQVMHGGSPISPAIVHHLLRQIRAGSAPQLEDAARRVVPLVPANAKLTPRELEVLQLLADGASYAEVATRLSVSINTVRTHIRNLYDKLAVKSRGKLAPWADIEKLIRWKSHRG